MQSMLNYTNVSNISAYSRYPNITAKTLTKLWVGNYWYFFKDTNSNSEWCRSIYTNSKMSLIREALSSKYTVYSKPGWNYVGTYGGTQNDAGIVMAGNNPYIICILSNGINYPSALNELALALDAVHEDMVQ
jgi:hypothetical protein